MLSVNKSLTPKERMILKDRVGSCLETIEGYYLRRADDIILYQIARLHFDDGAVMDVHNSFKAIPIGEPDEIEDVGTLAVSVSDGNSIWVPAGEATETEVLNVQVQQVGIIVDDDVVFRGGEPINEMRFAQALVFDTGVGYVSIDKGPFTEDFLYLRVTGNLQRCARDTREDWRCDEPYSDTYSRTIEWL